LIQLKKFIASRWQKTGSGEYRLRREMITAVSRKEAKRICDIRKLNEMIQLWDEITLE